MLKYSPPHPLNESERLAALRELHIVDTLPEPHFDAVCEISAAFFHVPIAIVSLIDSNRQWFQAKCGINTNETPRDAAFCAYAIHSDEVFVVEDAASDPRFYDNPLVAGEAGIRFYAGAPLVLRSGIRLGTLCIKDTTPRSFSDNEKIQLQDLARIVVAHMEMHRGRIAVESALLERARSEARIAASEARCRALADVLPQLVWVMSGTNSTIHYINEQFRTYYGPMHLQREECFSRNHPADAEHMAEAWQRALSCQSTYAVEGRLCRHDGIYRWHKLIIIPVRREGAVVEWLGTALDIEDIVTARDTLEQTTDMLRFAQEAAGAGIWQWDLDEDVVHNSPESARMHGIPCEPGSTAWVNVSVAEWGASVHPDDLAQIHVAHAAALDSDTTYKVEFRVRKADESDDYRWLMGFGRIIRDEALGRPLRIVGLNLDVTERKVSEQRIAYMARHDVLTGLANRAVFHEHLDYRLAEVRHGRGHAALLCLDLDRFKSINDTLGHPAGDELLRQIAKRLKTTVRESDVVVRLGGDEFAIIVSHLDYALQASLLAQRVIDAVGQPLDLNGHLVTVGVSIGIALAPINGDEPERLAKNADLALYRAKATARNTYRLYEAGMDAILETRMQLEVEIREAVLCGNFALEYQPVLNLADDCIVGFEALMRWPHPIQGMISPDQFIPLAEETGLIVPLGAWALHEACREAATWPNDLRIAVNVSAIQFQQPGLEQNVISALGAAGLAPHRLELEITESVLVHDAEAVIACLHRLRLLGVRIALDDFGTGYSSLSYLRRFPFDKIKIDRSFVREINNPDTAAIVRAVVGIATQLGASVTAEGIETVAQLTRVSLEGCCEVQGYLISKPMSSSNSRKFIVNSSFIKNKSIQNKFCNPSQFETCAG